jgi:hypothetical protein
MKSFLTGQKKGKVKIKKDSKNNIEEVEIDILTILNNKPTANIRFAAIWA